VRKLDMPSRLADRVLANVGIGGPMSSDIPLRMTAHGKYRYPLRNMIVGEHFWVPANGRSVEKLQNSVSSSVNNIQRKTRLRFTQRRYTKCREEGIRVWRTQ